MARIILNDVDPETMKGLELRAKRLGTTVEEVAFRLLAGVLAEARGSEGAEGCGEPNEALDSPTVDSRFIEKNGFLVFAGELPPDAVTDHRALRDERIEALLRGFDARQR
jgi:hypothetical protein